LSETPQDDLSSCTTGVLRIFARPTESSELIFSKIAGVSHKMTDYMIRCNVLNAEGMRVEPHLTVVN
jgi:hypothetical protein